MWWVVVAETMVLLRKELYCPPVDIFPVVIFPDQKARYLRMFFLELPLVSVRALDLEIEFAAFNKNNSVDLPVVV